MSWARLLKRVFDIDIERCPNCGSALKIIAAIEDPPVIVRILTHLGLPTRAPPRSPVRPLALFQAAWSPDPIRPASLPELTSPLGLRSCERPQGVDLGRLRSMLGPKIHAKLQILTQDWCDTGAIDPD
jgi:hypothetical protein